MKLFLLSIYLFSSLAFAVQSGTVDLGPTIGGGGGGGSGTVTSVGLSLPSIFTVTGSPVTTNGTLTGTFTTEGANTVLAGPTSGSAAIPAFRALVSGDIPSLSYVSSVTGTSPIVSSGGLTPAISCIVASGSTAGCLSSADWTTFNNKANSFTVANVVYVNASGNDTTCVANRQDLQCATLTKAMSLITNPAVISLILIQDAGTYSVDGLIFKANVFIQGPDPISTILDFGNSGITIDTSWDQTGPSIGGITNLGMTSSGSISALTFDFSSITTGNNSFNFNNVQLPGGLPLDLTSSGTANETTFNVTNVIQQKGALTFTDATGLVSAYFNQNDGITINSTGTNDSIVYSTGSSYFGAVNLTGATGRAILLMTSGSIFGTITLNNATSLMQAQMGTLPANSSITNSGGTLVYGGDAYQVPYFPASPTAWPSPAPTQVSQALDVLVGLAGSAANSSLSNLTTTSINQSLIPNADSTFDLGTGADRWNNIYASSLVDATTVPVVDITNRILDDGSALAAVAFNSRTLYAGDGTTSILQWGSTTNLVLSANLVMGAGGTYSIANSGAPAANMFSNNYTLYDNFGDEDGLIYEASPNGFGVEAIFPGITGSFPAGNLVLSTNNSSQAITGNVNLVTGNGVGFGSGNINLNVGTASTAAGVGVVTTNTLLQLPVQTLGSTPANGVNGALAITSAYILCVYNGSSWVTASTGSVACVF